MKNEQGEPLNPEVPNRRQLLLKLGELIPKLATRHGASASSSSSSSSSSSDASKSQGKQANAPKNKGRKK